MLPGEEYRRYLLYHLDFYSVQLEKQLEIWQPSRASCYLFAKKPLLKLHQRLYDEAKTQRFIPQSKLFTSLFMSRRPFNCWKATNYLFFSKWSYYWNPKRDRKCHRFNKPRYQTLLFSFSDLLSWYFCYTHDKFQFWIKWSLFVISNNQAKSLNWLSSS